MEKVCVYESVHDRILSNAITRKLKENIIQRINGYKMFLQVQIVLVSLE